MSANWRPHTEHPEQDLETVILATRDDEGCPFLLGIYTYRAYPTASGHPAGWWNECTDKHAPREFFWTIENELLETLP